MLKTKIISAFPATGKSSFFRKNQDTCLDSDSSQFSWITNEHGNKIRNINFLEDYINHIKSNYGKYEYIFVSSHKEVRDALKKNLIFYYLFYPDIARKEEFLERCRNRGNDGNFVKLIHDNWENWINAIQDENEVGFSKIRMIWTDSTLEDYLKIYSKSVFK